MITKNSKPDHPMLASYHALDYNTFLMSQCLSTSVIAAKNNRPVFSIRPKLTNTKTCRCVQLNSSAIAFI